MKLIETRQLPVRVQLLFSIAFIVSIALICFFAKGFLGYKVVALILLMTVSVNAMLFGIVPVLVSCVLSALIWNFFFIPPLYTFRISNAEDALMFSLYFIIALLNAVLTSRIRKAEQQVRDKNEKEKVISLYNTLLNSLSHEFRTPLATIQGSIDILKSNSQNLTASQKYELLNETEIACERLNRQVENLLNMSRLESGVIHPGSDWFDLIEMINSIIQKVNSEHTHDFKLLFTEPFPLMKTDAGFVEQMLHNLLHNAVSHTPDGSSIEVFAEYHDQKTTITITDNGPGFTEEERAKSFDKFYRKPQSKPGGSGLGLSIVKGIAEALGGTVTLAESRYGGAQFVLEFPAVATYLNNLKNE